MDARPAVFLLPGLLCDEFIWRDQTGAFGRFADVIIPDFRNIDSIGAMADAALSRAPAKFSVAGHSMGARAALEMVRRAPDRIERLALLDTGIHPRGPAEEGKRGALVDLARRQGMAAMAAEWLPPMLHPAHLSLLGPLTEMVLGSTPDSFAAQQRALLDRPNAREVLPMIRCPTLVLCGREDQWSPVPQHEEIAAAIPGSKLVIVDECGHMSPAEQPAEVTKALLEWMGWA
ncbi:MAG TPA: alpha/beta fold hydrolase [Bryobacteraceae bacterium]|nr:alpha/beta fold hydrolase [Bryobacteraceae bacterium]